MKHMGISNLTEKRLKSIKQSAISDHLLQCNGMINFDNFDILAAESNKFKLLLRESLFVFGVFWRVFKTLQTDLK